ncbi:hypothetical protein GCM10010112_62620 [Actinoplanes lobatus]|uniref:Uncharacterized protein n=1 Tax=Actinoplanes lobatus TaxID=113568 RepID=A0A7W7MJ44_9ACTN|nr:hypothetical protein [Actinoplanes lobatus]MBB4752194.1 hypothetical protein [Actinoplanes lobatus]GGN83866.1 hypothetical protein GCM10010112_62620 [Actinoplanes lobatus]GIE45455.1 hypothetical protein Alo02nite_83530 [Actinoplanes lobatus]
MSDLKLSLPQRALLLILMAENAELSNNEIAEKYAPGLRLTGKPKEKLVDAKLIECRRGPKGLLFFSLADGGWRWGREELAREAPQGSGSAGQALYAVLHRLEEYLDRTGRSLAQVFGDQPEEKGNPAPVEARPAADEIEKRIRRAYRELANPVGSWVGLADLREGLTGLAKADVDGVLRLMARMSGVLVEEETNQKSLQTRDRDAAVVIGSRAHHVLAIEE